MIEQLIVNKTVKIEQMKRSLIGGLIPYQVECSLKYYAKMGKSTFRLKLSDKQDDGEYLLFYRFYKLCAVMKKVTFRFKALVSVKKKEDK
ncbi:MAG: hypothetical protein KAS32_22335 [Candidatus Peribacteraceae bacterium]|nr:hypothetical protein [Candidatus Peribacteraceae bacterium]